MVRRRTASPRPSSPVRSASPNRQSAAPTRSATGSTSPPPPTSGGGGFMSQMAATAGGVAIGSAIGHAVGNMMSGSGSQEAGNQATTYETTEPQQKQYQQPCEFEWRQFIECTQNQSDLSVCGAFNDVFKQCQARVSEQKYHQ